MLNKINETSEYIKSKISEVPEIAIILGTGLGALVDHIKNAQYIPYNYIRFKLKSQSLCKCK